MHFIGGDAGQTLRMGVPWPDRLCAQALRMHVFVELTSSLLFLFLLELDRVSCVLCRLGLGTGSFTHD